MYCSRFCLQLVAGDHQVKCVPYTTGQLSGEDVSHKPVLPIVLLYKYIFTATAVDLQLLYTRCMHIDYTEYIRYVASSLHTLKYVLFTYVYLLT